MNLLVISNLYDYAWSGPSHSVPQQIHSFSRYCNICWLNTNSVKNEKWKKDKITLLTIEECPSLRLKDLPVPFNTPDFAIIEEVYVYCKFSIFHDLIKNKIPYIIIPRSQLTDKAQNNKALKKKIGNMLIFNKIIYNSTAIQYLTEQEKEDSSKFKHKSFILPNGINKPDITKKEFSKDKIKAVYIGRLNYYQKGLDILLSAIEQEKEFLIKNNFTLTIYGPHNSDGFKQISEEIVKRNISEIVSINCEVSGKEKENILLDSDVFIMTSRFEGLPMGLLEALSYGLPCMVTKGTNLKDEIINSNSGWGCDNSIEDVSAKLRQMVNDKDKFNIISSNAVELSNKYNWDSIAKETIEIIKNL